MARAYCEGPSETSQFMLAQSIILGGSKILIQSEAHNKLFLK